MIFRIHIACTTLVVMAALGACTKLPDLPAGPAIDDYRTYDVVSVAVKEDPMGGYILLCKNTPLEEITSSLRFLAPDGEPTGLLDFASLPLRIENITFAPSDLLYTDFIPRTDGSLIILGLGLQRAVDDRAHLIVHVVDRQGHALAPPFRRYLAAHTVLTVNAIGSPRQSLQHLPRSRALGAIAGNDLITAARWETATEGGIAVHRFPLAGSVEPPLQIALHSDREGMVHALAHDPAGDRTVLVTDTFIDDKHSALVTELAPTGTTWGMPAYGALAPKNHEPSALLLRDGRFTLLGHTRDVPTAFKARPFVITFMHAGEVSGQEPEILDIASDNLPVVSYVGGWWDNRFQLITNVHQSSTLSPFFNGDITSDLTATDVDLTTRTPGASSTIVPGQGFRPLGYFTDHGARVVIGVQSPYLNTAFVHTFFLTIRE